MPTENHAKVRILLKHKKARVIRRCPFTIQLLYECTDYTQKISLGIDAGSKHIGISATTEKKVLYEADVAIRNDIVELISARRELRRGRRNRKTRYRAKRFQNRKRDDKWLAPSILSKVQSHLTAVRKVCEVLPVSSITVEVASFDIQKIKNPDISGTDYQQGEQLSFFNVREYVLFRDGHICQCCKGKSKDPVLNVHHIESRQTGGNSPGNLITLCETCHKGYHNKTVVLPEHIRRGKAFRDAAFMGIMRWAFYNRLKELYPVVHMTYGYITKNTRIKSRLPKEHYTDARCISGNPLAKPSGFYFLQKKVRCHNRQIHKCKVQKGGVRKRNQAAYLVKGFRLFDKVRYHGQVGFIFGRRSSGYFDIRTLNGEVISRSASYKKLCLLETKKNYLTLERRSA